MAPTQRCLVALVAGLVVAALASDGVRAGDAPAPAPAEAGPTNPAPPQLSALAHIPLQLSRECKVKSPAFEGRSALRVVRHALREKRPIKVLTVGTSTSLSGGGASAVANYPVRLENDLQGFLKGFAVDMVSRGLSGDISEDAAERMKREVAELKPDLVVWQVGTSEAMARLDTDEFVTRLRDTLHWLADNHIDAVLVDPQYIESLKDDSKYTALVKTIDDVARAEHVLLVRRFEAMADLSGEIARTSAESGERVELTDLGYRCMAEYAARAIVGGILQADAERSPKN